MQLMEMRRAYSGVPHSVYVLPFTCFANPKSVICAHKTTTRKQSCSKRIHKHNTTTKTYRYSYVYVNSYDS